MKDSFGLPVIDGRVFRDRIPGGQLLAGASISTLQVNLGLYCNLACKHCHVSSSPKRIGNDENMSADTADRLIRWLDQNGKHRREDGIEALDLTGGSPEANPCFRDIVTQASAMGIRVIDRCNPTIIPFRKSDDQGFQWIPEFLAQHKVQVVASLPCYLEDNVRSQRGLGAYDASIDGLTRLNEVGYGSDPELRLNLVYNPTGPHLPPSASGLEEDYRRELKQRFGLVFNELWTITNMPIARWRDDLARRDKLEDYMLLLATAFNPATLEHLMCRHQIHIDSQGNLHDCDFNYALGLKASTAKKKLWENDLSELADRVIMTAEHCLGCTADCGSSCGGALV